VIEPTIDAFAAEIEAGGLAGTTTG
jgi:hypothetical protein